jgi:hypothetical protein
MMMMACHYLTGGNPPLFVDDEMPGAKNIMDDNLSLWMKKVARFHPTLSTH